MQLDVDYAVMCQAAKKWLDTLWVVDIGDFAMDGNGEVGVVTNRDKQDLGTDEEIPTKVAFVGVSYSHNNRLWYSDNPIWLPRLDQLLLLHESEYMPPTFGVIEELKNIMRIHFSMYWNPKGKQWEEWPPK